MALETRAFDLRYPEKVRNILIAAGSLGISAHDLNQKVRTPNYKVADLHYLLRAWHKRRWIDKFTVKEYRTSPKVLYRATRLLDEEWRIMLSLVSTLIVEGPPSDQDAYQSETSDPVEEVAEQSSDQ